MELFDGRRLAIATKHGKEQVIATLLSLNLGVIPFVPDNLDTDAFGTFTGEKARQGSALDAARKKAAAAMEITGCSLAIASEGSFGLHPTFGFVSAADEIVVLIDTENDLEIIGRYVTMETNFAYRNIENNKDLVDFSKRVGFPEHGLIFKITDQHGMINIVKDKTSHEEIEKMVAESLASECTVQAETDMRAMNNPTRMKAIEQATRDLMKQIQSLCPQCQMPGFAIKEVLRGLPCEWCGSPTRTAKSYLYQCQKCQYSEEKPNPRKTLEDPMHCNYCNP